MEILSALERIYEIFSVPKDCCNSSNLFCDISSTLTCAPDLKPFLIASVPATPAPTTVTSLALTFSIAPNKVPRPLFGFNKKYWPTTRLICPAILLIGDRSGKEPSSAVTVS